MKYTRDERIDIGRQVYTHELSHKEAMQKYDIVSSSVDMYVRMYKTENGIPTKSYIPEFKDSTPAPKHNDQFGIEDYMAMSKEELINELILAKANELRAKKGYEVKGVGANKEYVSLNNKNTK